MKRAAASSTKPVACSATVVLPSELGTHSTPQIAAELLRIGPYHSADDHWAPTDWQLLLVVSEYMSALLEVRGGVRGAWGCVSVTT